jgi:hypothetical protein
MAHDFSSFLSSHDVSFVSAQFCGALAPNVPYAQVFLRHVRIPVGEKGESSLLGEYLAGDAVPLFYGHSMRVGSSVFVFALPLGLGGAPSTPSPLCRQGTLSMAFGRVVAAIMMGSPMGRDLFFDRFQRSNDVGNLGFGGSPVMPSSRMLTSCHGFLSRFLFLFLRSPLVR